MFADKLLSQSAGDQERSPAARDVGRVPAAGGMGRVPVASGMGRVPVAGDQEQLLDDCAQGRTFDAGGKADNEPAACGISCRLKRRLPGILAWAAFLFGFAALLFALNFSLVYPLPGDIQAGNDYQRARVLQVQADTLAPDPQFGELRIGVQTLELEIVSGEHSGKRIVLKNFVTRLQNQPAEVGTLMIVSSYDNFTSGMIVGYDRIPVLLVMTLLFLALVLIISRAKGARSLFGLAFTLICVIYLFIPLLLYGVNPILAAVIIVILSSFVSLAALNGAGYKTYVAGVACSVCTLVAGVIAIIFGALLHASTYTTPEVEDLIFIAQNTSLQLPEILFAGILIATSGALLDTTMSIASAQAELIDLDATLSPKQLWKSGMNIGRDIMGTMTHTLIMAFAGASINSLMIIFMYQMPLVRTINLDLLVVEVFNGLTGSIALALAIPVTAALGAWGSRRFTRRESVLPAP